MRRRGVLVRIDFLQPAAMPSALGRTCLTIGAAALVLVAWAGWTDSRAGDALADSAGRVAAPAIRVAAPTGEALRRTAAEQAQVRRVVGALSRPWDALFADLEAASSADATLLAVRPDDGGRALRLSGEAKDFESVLAYVSRLQRARTLANVLLASHETGGAGATVSTRFVVTADWAGGSGR